MSQDPYWFARRYPVGSPRNGMAPVSAEGRGVMFRFVASMVIGALAMGVLMVISIWTHWAVAALGIVIYVVAAVYGAWQFISQAQSRGDHQHTIEDYKAGRVPGQLPHAGR